MRTALQNNSLGHFQETLLDLSDPERQLSYKREVPFVHVPIELLEQWSGHRRKLREQVWFRSLFTSEQVARINEFDDILENRSRALDPQLPDVPDILEHSAWRDISSAAKDL